MQVVPHARRLPIPQPAPAGHPTAIPEFRWQPCPLNTGFEDEQNASKHLPRWQARTPSVPLTVSRADVARLA